MSLSPLYFYDSELLFGQDYSAVLTVIFFFFFVFILASWPLFFFLVFIKLGHVFRVLKKGHGEAGHRKPRKITKSQYTLALPAREENLQEKVRTLPSSSFNATLAFSNSPFPEW